MSVGTRVALRGLDPEAVRTGFELRIMRRLRAHLGADLRVLPPSYEHTSAALEVDAGMDALAADPRVHRVVDEARRVLGVEREVEVHPTNASWAAAHYTEGGPLVLSVHWRAFTHVDDDALLAVVGHELGHHLAHGARMPEGPDPHVAYHLLGDDDRPDVRATAAAGCRAAELTADRFALLACQDVDAVLRLFMALSDEAVPDDPAAFLASSIARVRGLIERRERARGDTHPETAVRAYAVWLFAHTDVYRELTGHGEATRSIHAVDAALGRLVGPPRTRRAAGQAPPPRDDAAWMDDVGEAIYAGSEGIGKALGDVFTKVTTVVRGARRPAPDVADRDDEPELDADDLEARFRALERDER